MIAHLVTINNPMSISSADLDTSFIEHLNDALFSIWQTLTCRAMQVAVVEALVFGKECTGKLLFVNWTGGKSHILWIILMFNVRINLIIMALLSLTVDQLAKVQVAPQDHDSF